MPDQAHDNHDTRESSDAARPARADARISASTLEAARAVARYYEDLRTAPTSPDKPAPTSRHLTFGTPRSSRPAASRVTRSDAMATNIGSLSPRRQLTSVSVPGVEKSTAA